jgi:hypothetical protein
MNWMLFRGRGTGPAARFQEAHPVTGLQEGIVGLIRIVKIERGNARAVIVVLAAIGAGSPML